MDREDDRSAYVPEVGPSTPVEWARGIRKCSGPTLPVRPVPCSWLPSRWPSSGRTGFESSTLRVMQAEGSGQVPGCGVACGLLRAWCSVQMGPGGLATRAEPSATRSAPRSRWRRPCVGCNGLVHGGDHRLTIDVTLSAAHMGTLWGMGTDSASRSFRGAWVVPGTTAPLAAAFRVRSNAPATGRDRPPTVRG